jgi:hypothetical protein
MASSPLALGGSCSLDGRNAAPYLLPPHHLVTHGVVVGMTGSGKTGMLTVLCEEALRCQIPILMMDVKGDLPNLLLSFPTFDPAAFLPWAEGVMGPQDERSVDRVAKELAEERERQLTGWGIGREELVKMAATTEIRVLTPGSNAGEPIHLLSSLERRSPRWDTDPDAAQTSLSAAVSLVLRLVGRDPDPARSRDHVLLSVLAERRLRAGQNATLSALLDDLHDPPIDAVGALAVDDFLSKSDRRGLASSLNNLLASPTFAAWRTGETLDVGAWMTPKPGARTPAVIVSVAHLDETERALVLGVLLEEILAWTRQLSGTSRLRALVVFDEVYGYLPPYPHNPPTKRPLVALLKQARAFGVGVVVATQNPMDLDYRALGNAGLWCLGRLQTDADRERVVEGLGLEKPRGGRGLDADGLLQKLAPRWFLVRDVHAKDEPMRLLQPRWAMSFLRGPMTRVELVRALAERR